MSDEQDQAALGMKVARLQQEHDDFHAAITAMIAQGCDSLQIQRMKKKKLEIKDALTSARSRIIPDIIA